MTARWECEKVREVRPCNTWREVGAIISKLETETLSSFSAAKDRVRELTSGSG